MGSLKDFVQRVRPQAEQLPISEDKVGYTIVGYRVKMAVAGVERTYWYPTLKEAARAWMRFKFKQRWPRKKNVRHVAFIVDAPAADAVE